MKGRMLMVLAFIAGIAVVGCKKDYTCTCNAVLGNVVGDTTVITIANSTKGNAEEVCDGKEESYDVSGLTYETKCSLD